MALAAFGRRRSGSSEHEDLADEGPKDLDREERRLETAVLNGDIPPIWYGQRMAALAADPVTAVPVEDTLWPRPLR